MSSIIDFDIDALEPVALLNIMKDNNREGVPNKKYFSTYHHRQYDSDFPSAGYSVKALFDWRRLERRYSTLNKDYDRASTKYWDFIRYLVAKGIAAGAVETWIPTNGMIGCGPSYYLLIRHNEPDILTSTTFQEIFDNVKTSTTKRGYHVQGDELELHRKLYSRRETTLSRARVFRNAFQEAINLRISPWFQNHYVKKHFFNDMIMIRNDDRVYLLSYKPHTLTWHDGNVHMTPDGS